MENILIVEDEAITAMDLQRNLEKIGFTVKGVTATGEEAIDLANEIMPDLILMDIMLAGEIDGTMAARQITQNQNVPIIFITAYNDEKTFNRAKQPNTYHYLTKPFHEADLKIAIDLALYKHKMTVALANAEKRYRTVMDNAVSGIIVYDKAGVIQEVNKSAEQIFGMDKSCLIGNNIKSFLPQAEKDYFEIKLEKLLNESLAKIEMTHIEKPCGMIRDVEILSTAAHLDDNHILFSLINDVTEKNKLQEMTIFNDKLATIGTLTSSIIHEINNPLSSILINIEMASNTLASLKQKGLNGEVHEAHELINQLSAGANQIKTIVSDLKSFGRKDATLNLQHINKLVDAAVSIVMPQFKHHVQIIKNFSDALPLLLINSGKLEQVLINILLNAYQAFTDLNDYSSNLITITTTANDKNVSIMISDTGSGIPSNIIDHIFDPFFTTKGYGVGTGLGLSICKQIVTSMGGDISVHSLPGEGACFCVSLPIHLSLNDKAAIGANEVKIIKKRILVADHDGCTADIIEHIIGSNNHIVSVKSGREAITTLNREGEDNFDLFIVDLLMSDVTGEDLYRYLDRRGFSLKSKMLFITDNVNKQRFATFIANITNPVLIKPYSTKVLLSAISQLFKPRLSQ